MSWTRSKSLYMITDSMRSHSLMTHSCYTVGEPAIADEIKARGIDVSFVTSSRVDMVKRSLLEKLKSAGMSTIY